MNIYEHIHAMQQDATNQAKSPRSIIDELLDAAAGSNFEVRRKRCIELLSRLSSEELDDLQFELNRFAPPRRSSN